MSSRAPPQQDNVKVEETYLGSGWQVNVNVNVTSGLPATPGNNGGPMPQSRGESAQEVPDRDRPVIPPTTGPWRVDLSQLPPGGIFRSSKHPGLVGAISGKWVW